MTADYTPGTGPGGEVVDLDAARAARPALLPGATLDGIVVPAPDDEHDNLPAVPSDTSFEVALDDEPDTRPVAVDDGFGYVLDEDEPEAYPVIPAHLRSLDGIAEALGRHARRIGHRAAFHGVRSPVYLVKITWRAGVGVFRLGARQLAWWWVAETGHLRSAAVANGDAREWMRLHKEAKETRMWRGIILATEAAGLLTAGGLLATVAPWWIQAAAAAIAVPLLAVAGRPDDYRPVISPATTVPRYRVLNADTVLSAYYDAGLGDPVKPGQQVEFETRLADDGAGSGVGVILPRATTNDDAMKAKPALASALDVTVSQVYLTPSPVSHRRHHLWVAYRDPLAAPAGPTPLLACKPTDIWKPAPLGPDERGKLVELLMMWASIMVGGLPRHGKTFVARLLALYAALDPYVHLDVFDPSAKPDWRKFALVADTCAFGLTPTRDGNPAEMLLALTERMKKDVQDRYNRLSALPTSVCPEGKLTRQIARDPDYGMPVRVLALDEFQEWFDLGEISKDLAANLVYLAKVAPAAGYILLDATQKPSGIGGGGTTGQAFTTFRDMHAVRFALRTSSYNMSENVLGQGAYGEGLDSSTLLPSHKGVGILRGAGDDSPTVRTYLAGADDAEKILIAARKFRQQAGTLTGMAAGQSLDDDVRDVLADVLAVFDGEPGLHWPVVAERLARRFPDRWAGATADAISAQCRDLKVPSVDVKVRGEVLKGCRRRDIEAARPA
jgi:S-DNA-T family DNA segregation ATPase FtsK/SpoIIIE